MPSRRHSPLLTLALLATGLASAGAEIHTDGAWVREMPPVAERSAGYLTLHNAGDRDRAVTGASAEGFARVELHESVERDDTMRMEHRERIDLPAGERVALEPGGLHLMLLERAGEPLKEADGDRVALTLELDDGETVEVTAPVRRHAPDGDAATEDHDHH